MELYVSGAPPAALPEHGETGGGKTPWWETPYGRWRLTAELEAMRRFPDFRLAQDGRGHLGWTGWIQSSLQGGDRYLVRVMYPPGFPDSAPVVVIDEPSFQGSVPHLLDGKRPCLYRAVHGPGHGYDPARTTAATFVAWTALWVNAYEAWRATGDWPGRGE